jgi:hypothetical protein
LDTKSNNSAVEAMFRIGTTMGISKFEKYVAKILRDNRSIKNMKIFGILWDFLDTAKHNCLFRKPLEAILEGLFSNDLDIQEDIIDWYFGNVRDSKKLIRPLMYILTSVDFKFTTVDGKIILQKTFDVRQIIYLFTLLLKLNSQTSGDLFSRMETVNLEQDEFLKFEKRFPTLKSFDLLKCNEYLITVSIWYL